MCAEIFLKAFIGNFSSVLCRNLRCCCFFFLDCFNFAHFKAVCCCAWIFSKEDLVFIFCHSFRHHLVLGRAGSTLPLVFSNFFQIRFSSQEKLFPFDWIILSCNFLRRRYKINILYYKILGHLEQVGFLIQFDRIFVFPVPF